MTKAHIRELKNSADQHHLQTLLEDCTTFFTSLGDEPPRQGAASRVFSDLPPGKTLADKYILGLFSGEQLLGVIDLVRDYPEAGTWYLGLMLVHPDCRNNKVGQGFLQATEQWCVNRGAQALRLGVQEENPAGYRFWARQGLTEVKRVDYVVGDRKTKVAVLEKTLVSTCPLHSRTACSAILWEI